MVRLRSNRLATALRESAVVRTTASQRNVRLALNSPASRSAALVRANPKSLHLYLNI